LTVRNTEAIVADIAALAVVIDCAFWSSKTRTSLADLSRAAIAINDALLADAEAIIADVAITAVIAFSTRTTVAVAADKAAGASLILTAIWAGYA
jgi:hypothetical protein